MVLRSKLFFSLSNMAFSNTIIAVISEVMSIGMRKHRVKGGPRYPKTEASR